jgi:hypothetical protein
MHLRGYFGQLNIVKCSTGPVMVLECHPNAIIFDEIVVQTNRKMLVAADIHLTNT